MWTTSRSVTSVDGGAGDLDIKSSDYWGVAVDINVHPFAQLELLYTRQDSDLTFKPILGSTEDVGGAAVEYYQIGGLKGVREGRVLPYGLFTLGATRFVYKDADIDDIWKFSVILGLGAKVYLNERIGLRVQGALPFTFVNGGVGLGFGTGGGYVTVGGTGVLQTSVTAGLVIAI
jgi:hypothetical protein